MRSLARLLGGARAPSCRVLIASHAIAGLGLRRLLLASDIQITAQAQRDRAGAALVSREEPDVVVIDIEPAPAALEALRILLQCPSNARTAILLNALRSSHRSRRHGLGRVPIGGERGSPGRRHPHAVNAAVRGEPFISPIIARRLRRHIGFLGGVGRAPCPT